MTLIAIEHLTKSYRSHSLLGTSEPRCILNDISLTLNENETVALLGRSGCGKSTLARQICGLEYPEKGHVLYRGTPIRKLNKTQYQQFRSEIQMVFQDPPSAVDPRFTIEQIIDEPLKCLTTLDEQQRKLRIEELLAQVELPLSVLSKLPSQISGGQLQRICVARALASDPKLVILDEAVSNLDIHLQASLLTLLKRLQEEQGIAYLFVTHDLRLVSRFAARVVVMDEGIIVETSPQGCIEQLCHPASLALKNAVLPPFPTPRQRTLA
ncbi:nickel import ATP-binding protein NikE [Providencia sneebia]|uniref:Nickel import ATP-binding protein NikE n=1 Tax=Providencia sneebia DSM 19967 TaxID=1141660 RepID=K8WIF8_9GAMM|nr:nickel transporter ATP-binding protein NikE [Providencia sneebia DSM 19967]